jgi:putative transposase
MKVTKKGHTEEQILRALGQAEGGTGSATFVANMGSARRPTTAGKNSTRGFGLSELYELRQLREENAKLRRLVADLSLDRHMLQEIVQKSSRASTSARARAVDPSRLCC